MSKTSIRLVSSLLGLVLLSCGGGRTALLMLPSDTEANDSQGAGAGPGGGRQPTSDAVPCPTSAPCNQEKGPGCAIFGSDPMGCAACARARVTGLSCVAGTCQQHPCTGPVTFRKLAGQPNALTAKFSEFWGADMNRDGRLDLLEVYYPSPEDSELVLWLGQSDGTFVVSPSYPTVGKFATPNLPDYAAVGDFNEDGLADLVVTEGEDRGAVWIRPGLPGGGWGGRRGRPAPRELMADLDGDCHLDFVTSPKIENDPGNTQVWVLRGRGNGTLTSPRKVLIRDYGMPTAVADWNGDGLLDILVNGHLLHVLPGKGDGSFADEQQCAVGAGIIGVLNGLVYADLNRDGRLDLLWHGSTGLATLFGQGGCSFTPLTRYDISLGILGLAVGDLNGDGLPDLAVAGGPDPRTGRGNAMALLLGNADGSFTRQRDLAFESTYATKLFITDVNGDGRADLVVALNSGGIQVLVNTCE